jgi:hypothetical protein
MSGLESLTNINIGFQSAIIYLPNTLADAPECFKHRVHQYLGPASSAYQNSWQCYVTTVYDKEAIL